MGTNLGKILNSVEKFASETQYGQLKKIVDGRLWVWKWNLLIYHWVIVANSVKCEISKGNRFSYSRFSKGPSVANNKFNIKSELNLRNRFSSHKTFNIPLTHSPPSANWLTDKTLNFIICFLKMQKFLNKIFSILLS